MPGPRRLLILGGTGEAAALARAVTGAFGDRLAVVSSLAGRLGEPPPLPGTVRIGGFGGPQGLADWLRAAATDLVIDATHPFAARISAHARAACDAVGLPRLQLRRPAWRPRDGDRWIMAASAAAAAARLPDLGRRAFLTVGTGSVQAFSTVSGVWLLVRLAAPPPAPLPLATHDLLIARGPFTPAGESGLIARHRIDVLVTKGSGGAATAAKLTAAREAGLPVLMIRRPPAEPGDTAATVEETLAWLATKL